MGMLKKTKAKAVRLVRCRRWTTCMIPECAHYRPHEPTEECKYNGCFYMKYTTQAGCTKKANV